MNMFHVNLQGCSEIVLWRVSYMCVKIVLSIDMEPLQVPIAGVIKKGSWGIRFFVLKW